MNDNYLWDRTGEPDAEVQELEELLGSLRYQPRPLEIPATMNLRRKRTFIPLAVAAAVALLLIGAGLWVRFANSNASRIDQASHGSQPLAAPNPAPAAPRESVATSSDLGIEKPIQPKPRRVYREFVALKPRRPIEPAAPVLSEAELAQKEQVLIALRLVSAKLNFAQRKAQGLPQVNAIRNHKIG
jgi:hypothetical protein